ncbi:UNVERIFIED_ORG: drug/metabolite transporter (DMT)-like permease [Methylobacterium sp. SuP10 SLI 274]|nr:drug/metabolite transporter (DMT)-like permease [Methylorubrum extorquens]MDF9789365.1 drug/metabolite transporter (DMT)-like permease [Methylorubrum extorquens]MDH6640031.1 drug/metabolite transporter (DMT)-like permease [Methylobacterium sp. SuP10 SLI 274]MDH6669212.1 drug/metabolite transporter (DMT)-like permease [Methylorubrum zatmanii]
MLVLLGASGRLILPPRADAPVILGVALLHMVAFLTLTAAGLAWLPASKGIVLGYTTPLWLTLAAPAVLGERLTRAGAVGAGIGLTGLAVLLNPITLDWSRHETVLGCTFVLAAAICWAANILVGRVHRWIATPLQLLPWQAALAGVVLTAAALARDGWPQVAWTPRVLGLLAYSGLVGTALAYWAMSMVTRSLPALTTALGVTATPLVGIAVATAALGEPLNGSLAMAAGLVVAGIVVSTLAASARPIAAK